MIEVILITLLICSNLFIGKCFYVIILYRICCKRQHPLSMVTVAYRYRVYGKQLHDSSTVYHKKEKSDQRVVVREHLTTFYLFFKTEN
jgi:hypothetical protein